MIVPVAIELCQSARQFFEVGGNVEVSRPSRCLRLKEECGSLEPLHFAHRQHPCEKPL